MMDIHANAIKEAEATHAALIERFFYNPALAKPWKDGSNFGHWMVPLAIARARSLG